MKILFLEDDPILADIVNEYLKLKKYLVDYSYDIKQAQSFMQENTYDLYLFDVNVPDGDSFSFLQTLRKENDNTPTIFLTALNSVENVKKGFKSGCDDYLKKPFELDELDIRIENLKRIFNINQNFKISHNLELNKPNFTLINKGKEFFMREKEFEILYFLANNHGRLVSTEELCTNIWEYDSMPSDATIRSYIRNLRKLIGDEKILTIKGIGYRFIKS